MKILSNFDTERAKTLLQEAEEAFGEGNAMLVRKSQMYFYQHIGFPIFGFLLVLIAGGYTVLMVEEVPVEAQWGFLILIGLIACILWFRLSTKRIDYTMDYLLITPKEVTKYDQGGVLHRDVESVHVNKIKSISVSKHGFFQSFFDIGSLTFLAEGEEGDIVMSDIDAVGHTERKIKKVMGMMG